MTLPYGVTGASGYVGGAVARALAGLGLAQRLVVRDPSRAPALAGAEVAQAAYDDAAAMGRALEGVGSLFLVSAHGSADRLHQHLTAVDAAAGVGVARIVYLSFLGAAPEATFTLAREHHATEERIRAHGLRFTFLRPSLYADHVPLMCFPDGNLRGPAGDGSIAWIARDDLCAAALTVLTQPGHDGQTYDITGPVALTLDETAQELSAAAGREVRYVPETIEEAYASRAYLAAPAWRMDGWVSSYSAIATGEMAVVSPAVSQLTGRPATSLSEVLRMHPESYRHLAR